MTCTGNLLLSPSVNVVFALDVEKVQGVKVYARWMLLAGHVIVVERVTGEKKVWIDSYIHVPHE